MTWREAISLTQQLMKDPSSRVSAATSEWAYPLSREGFILADLFDLNHQGFSGKRQKPYPRPDDKIRGRQRSKVPTVSQATIRAALAARGHGRKRIAGEPKKPNA